MMSVYKCRVNGWNVKGEMILGHAHAHGDADVQDPAARRMKKRCLRREVSEE